MLDRTPYAREDMRYSHQRQEPPAYTSSSRFGADAPGSVPSQMASDRDLDRERHRYDARDGRDPRFGEPEYRPMRSPIPAVAAASPALRPGATHEMLPPYARGPNSHVVGSNGLVRRPTSPYSSAPNELSRHPSSHSVHSGADRGPPFRMAPSSSGHADLNSPRAPPPLPTYASSKVEPSPYASMPPYSSLPLDPAMMEDEAQVVDPALQRSPLPSAASAHSTPAPAPRSLAQPVPDSQKQREKSAGSNGTDAPRSNGTDVNAGKGKEDESEVQDREKVREQARKMARSMRPDASDAEIERLVENFIGGGEGSA